MHKIKPIAHSMLAASALMVAPVMAEFSASANVTLTTDYVWRGVSQSDENPAVQGSLDVAHESGFYIGIWGSNVKFDDATVEFNAYGGFASELANGLGYDIGITRYIYPGTDEDIDWNEVHLGLSYNFFSGSVHYSNDVFGSDERGVYSIVGVDYPLPQAFGVNASIGYYDFNRKVFGPDLPDSYLDWKLGVTKTLGGFDFELSYIDTDSDGRDLFGDVARSRVLFTISREI